MVIILCVYAYVICSCFVSFQSIDILPPHFHFFILFRGHLKAFWSNTYPKGIIYYLEPDNDTATDPPGNYARSSEFSKPHRLHIVPISSFEQFNFHSPNSAPFENHSAFNGEQCQQTSSKCNDTISRRIHVVDPESFVRLRRRRGESYAHSDGLTLFFVC